MQKTYALAVIKPYGRESLKLPLMTLSQAEKQFKTANILAEIRGIHLVIVNLAAQ